MTPLKVQYARFFHHQGSLTSYNTKVYIDDEYSALSGNMDLVIELMDLLWMREYGDVFIMIVV